MAFGRSHLGCVISHLLRDIVRQIVIQGILERSIDGPNRVVIRNVSSSEKDIESLCLVNPKEVRSPDALRLQHHDYADLDQ